MTEHSLPHFSNSSGAKEIFVGVKKFMCAGASAPLDHPHTFLTMGHKNEKLCPYCSTIYRFDAELPRGQTRPQLPPQHHAKY